MSTMSYRDGDTTAKVRRRPLGTLPVSTSRAEMREISLRSAPSGSDQLSALRAKCHAAVRKRKQELIAQVREAYEADIANANLNSLVNSTETSTQMDSMSAQSSSCQPVSSSRIQVAPVGFPFRRGGISHDFYEDTKYALYTMARRKTRDNVLKQLSNILQNEQENLPQSLNGEMGSQAGAMPSHIAYGVRLDEFKNPVSIPDTEYIEDNSFDESEEKTDSQSNSPSRPFRFKELTADAFASIMRSMHKELMSNDDQEDGRGRGQFLGDTDDEAEKAVIDTDEVAELIRLEEEDFEFEKAARDLFSFERLAWEDELEIRRQIDDAEQHEAEESFMRELNLDQESLAEINEMMSEWL